MPDNNTNYRLATTTAAIAGVFSIVVCALLFYDYSRRNYINPSENDIYLSFKNTLAKHPDNQDLKTSIRNLDLRLRQDYYRQREFTIKGAVLLFFGIGIFIFSAKIALALRPEVHLPQPMPSQSDTEPQWTRTGRLAVAGFAVAFAACAVVLSIFARSDIPIVKKSTEQKESATTSGTSLVNNSKESANSNDTSPTNIDTPVTDEDIAKSWPSFRGSGGRGTSAYTNIPTTWDVNSDKNIRWKTPVPLPGNNSPIVWKDRVFLTGADKKTSQVYCFDSISGKLLWQKDVPTTQPGSANLKVNTDTGYAASTAATDGRRVFAIFANGELAAFDFNGKLSWSKSLGLPDNVYGHASSLVTYKNMVIVQFDQGASSKTAKSKLLAFDSATGNPVWATDRPVRNSWPSPIIIRIADNDQIVTAAAPWVIAYNPKTGKEIWRAKAFESEQDIGPSPTFAAGKVFVANESAALSAIRADGKGDVTATHIAWKGEDGLPDICSPLASDEYVILASYSTITCYDTEKGDQLWTEDFSEDLNSSPSIVGKQVFLFGKNGKSWIVEPLRDKCKKVSENNLGEECVTSPAFQDGCFYIRGKDNLFCIGTIEEKK